jgi:hypothetical protein
MKIIACASQYGNGKDELCNYLVTQMPDWKRGSLADPVKDIYCKAFGVTREFVELWKRNPEPPPGFSENVRTGLQYIGDGFRKIKEDVWIDIALKAGEQKIYSDSRYLNESRVVKSVNGVMIALYRPGFLNDDPNLSEAEIRPVIEWFANNIQEGPIPRDLPFPHLLNYDYFFINDGSIADMHRKIQKQLLPWVQGYFQNSYK